ncbi:MAG: rhamnulokinase family protein [Verrucomicrobiota bacterium]
MTHYLACDLGASSGRIMLGTLDQGKLTLEEIYRFPNGAIKKDDSLHWDITSLFKEITKGLKKAGGRKLKFSSISCDSWGVDYILYDAAGKIMKPVFHYRDPRTAKGVERMNATIGWEKIFAETGIQFMALNTLYQWAAENPKRFQKASQMLLIGDAVNHLFSGVGRAEVSLASTTQAYNPKTKAWSKPLVDALGIPPKLMPKIVPSGTVLGKLTPALAKATGLNGMKVIASCSHDTGAAVAAVPASGTGWAYLSSGTWSLMGVEWKKPVINDACRNLNYTNEIGYGNTVRLLKNISGLWLTQECRRTWEEQGTKYDFDTLETMAVEAEPFRSLINPADARFISPDNMPDRIAAFCKESGQPAPENPGQFIRCAFESLALLYHQTLERLEQLTGKKIDRLHIVGGGIKNELLNQFTANALQLPVFTGPVEGTAIGNILVQAIALGHLPNLAAARKVIRNSFEMKAYQPKDATQWNDAYKRMQALLAK